MRVVRAMRWREFILAGGVWWWRWSTLVLENLVSFSSGVLEGVVWCSIDLTPKVVGFFVWSEARDLENNEWGV